MNEQQVLGMLIQSLQLLASGYEIQVSSFPNFVHVPDELALTYHDCLLLASSRLEPGVIDGEQYARLTALDEFLDSPGLDSEIWTLESLKTHTYWQDVRSLAAELLGLFGAPIQRPHLDWIHYVRGKEHSDSDIR